MFHSASQEKRRKRSYTANLLLLKGTIGLLCIGISMAGCQKSNLAEVSGRVTFDGKPLNEGLITFQPGPQTNGPEFSGQVVAGEFRVVKSVLPGAYLVQIRSWQKTGSQAKSPFGELTEEIANVIPKRYSGPQSELTATLAAGSNSIRFDLEK